MREEIVRVPVGAGLTLEGTLAWDEALPMDAAEYAVVVGQMLPETREAVLPRVRRMAREHSLEWKAVMFCVDYRGYGGSGGAPDSAAVQADQEAVTAWLRQRVNPETKIMFEGWPVSRRADLHWLEIAPGVQLPVYHFRRDSGTSRGTVFLASSASVWEQMHDDLAERLVAAGYAVVGVSSAEVPERLWAATRQQVTMDQFFAAYERIWPFAQQLAGDDSPLLLIGHSAGSSGNLLLAAHVESRPGLRGRVRGLVGFGNSANKGFSLGFGEIVDHQVWQLEPYLPQVQVPVYMVQGDADFIPPAEVEAQVRLLPGKVHWQVIPGADHGFTNRLDELTDLVLAGLRFVAEN